MWLQKIKKRSWSVVALLAIAIALQSCLNSDEEGYNAYVVLEEDIKTIEEYLSANQIVAKMDSATGVFYRIHKFGEGYKSIQGVEIDVHYKGETLDGVEYVNTFEGDPKTIVIGSTDTYLTSMTDGLLVGLSLIKEGDSATIYVPSPWGFQDKGFQSVPANAILKYEIKLVEIKRLAEEYAKIDQYIADNDMEVEIEPNFGTRYAIHREGNGVSPKNGAFIVTDYQGELLDGTIFDSSYDSGYPLDFEFGSGSLIPGFEMGIAQLHENDSATIFVPSIYGYGSEARNEIPANSVLVFGLDIKRVSNIN